ncbi:biotin--[acetyl-CoA-carboxylase] ligase [Cognatishimia activa]|uniref:biotin--[biotin carboxyl-carrier protein] ligase n=1 Tax=Cognatishimia activa TaxID=1715691 RepID=A0A0P1IPP1_9RHOB|nr:biotin--[acetyl-CoA-carboxylase] ligase [Cognatishimia activa]CUJ22180.1 Bifunctional protein BirA [Cognatishimia activa]CUK25435.1 Bifunctional protein BirA [Cognatishimia activa]
MTDWPVGYGRRILAEVDSTNAEAARIAPDLAGPEWIVALRQTKARGRRGRAWDTETGNFAGTLVLHPNESADHMALRSFVASLALFDAFSAVTARPEAFSLKWPNDVLMNGGKVAGILLESAGFAGGRPSHLIIGIGVNLAHAPGPTKLEPNAVRPVSLLSEAGVNVDPESFLNVLAPAYAHWEQQFVTYGFEPIRSAWMSRAARIGEVITARTMREEYIGTFETVDNAGNLVLKTAQGAVAISAADIFF